ncbi:hypothetical protein QLY21_002267 [Salmonella enterica]|nr:hypothetical protein [Salmonella enterica]
MAKESSWKGAQTEKNTDDFSISRYPSSPPKQEKSSDSGSAERKTDDNPKE